MTEITALSIVSTCSDAIMLSGVAWGGFSMWVARNMRWWCVYANGAQRAWRVTAAHWAESRGCRLLHRRQEPEKISCKECKAMSVSQGLAKEWARVVSLREWVTMTWGVAAEQHLHSEWPRCRTAWRHGNSVEGTWFWVCVLWVVCLLAGQRASVNGVLRAGRLWHTKPELEAGRRLRCRLLHRRKEPEKIKLVARSARPWVCAGGWQSERTRVVALRVLSFAAKMVLSQTRCAPASELFACVASRGSWPISLSTNLTPALANPWSNFAAGSRIRNLLHQTLSLLTDKDGTTDCWIRRREKRD